MTPELDTFLRKAQQLVDEAMAHYLPSADQLPGKLHEAMRYVTLNGGKRIRPALVYATAEACGGRIEDATPAAVAVELIHAYSLVHDDLPAMDDDDLRRGQPTCHKKFDEATAILTGDALQALAFQVLAESTTPSDLRLAMIRALAIASGSQGMVGGQIIDLESEGKTLTLQALEGMHLFKTGALIEACVVLGALSAGQASDSVLAPLRAYARCIGLAFQVRDDILDIEGKTEVLGKTQGADIAHNKATYPALLGLEGAKKKCLRLHELAVESLAGLQGIRAERLAALSEFVVYRDR